MANEKRLIDANELIRFCDNEIDKYEGALNKWEKDYAKAVRAAVKIVRCFPTVDAVEVVRCKDFKHLEITGCYGECRKLVRIVKPWDFCSYGERRADT